MDNDATDNLLNGVGSDTDFILNNGDVGNPYIANQSGVDAADNGLVTGTVNPGGGATVALASPPWYQTLLGNAGALAGAAAGAATTLAPLINGQPGTPNGPAATNAAAAAGATTVKPTGLAGLFTLPVLIVVGLVAYFFFWKKKGR
jgi:hypothetical protein